MVDLVSERFAGSDKFKVLQEDFVKCHIRSHMLSILETRRLSHPDSALAKVTLVSLLVHFITNSAPGTTSFSIHYLHNGIVC
jgi:hypothetical protein